MRIGILTLPLNYNYGGILQAYALQTVLEQLGHQAVVFNFPFKRMSASGNTKVKRLIKKMLGRYDGYINFEEDFNSWLPTIEKYTNQFVNKHIHLSETLKAYDDIRPADYDAIIVGSDQIWRPRMFQHDIREAYLNFAKDWPIKRIAYAASFGTDQWEYTEQESQDCKELVHLFNAVSVREESGMRLCKKYFDIDAQWVLDPTMLLDCNDYKTVMGNCDLSEGKGKLFTYILDKNKEKDEIISKIEESKHLKAFSINSFDANIRCDLSKRIARPVEEWLQAIATSEFVIADSFHACVFSILFHKQFAVITNVGRGSTRISSLLKAFHLGNRIVSSPKDIQNLTEINYTKVDRILQTLKERSLNFIHNYL